MPKPLAIAGFHATGVLRVTSPKQADLTVFCLRPTCMSSLCTSLDTPVILTEVIGITVVIVTTMAIITIIEWHLNRNHHSHCNNNGYHQSNRTTLIANILAIATTMAIIKLNATLIAIIIHTCSHRNHHGHHHSHRNHHGYHQTHRHLNRNHHSHCHYHGYRQVIATLIAIIMASSPPSSLLLATVTLWRWAAC